MGRTTPLLPPVSEWSIRERIFTLLRGSLSTGAMYEILVQIVGTTNYQTNLTNYLSYVLTTFSLISQWHKVQFKKLKVPHI